MNQDRLVDQFNGCLFFLSGVFSFKTLTGKSVTPLVAVSIKNLFEILQVSDNSLRAFTFFRTVSRSERIFQNYVKKESMENF